MTDITDFPTPTILPSEAKHQRLIRRTIARKSFAVLATTSPRGRSHSVGVIYARAEGDLWVHTMAASRKARSIASNPHVGLCIVYRRLPIGPPFTIHFQATARIVPLHSVEVRSLIEAGHLGKITSHGELEMDGACFLRIQPGPTMHSFGTGVPTIDLIRDPLTAGSRSVDIDASTQQ